MKTKNKLENIDRLWKNTTAKIVEVIKPSSNADESDKWETINFLLILVDMCDLFIERRKIKANLKSIKASQENIGEFIQWYYEGDVKERYHIMLNRPDHFQVLYELFLTEEKLKSK